MISAKKAFVILIVCVLFLISNVSAIWVLQDPDYSGTVSFIDSDHGHAMIYWGIVSYSQDFSYVSTGPDQYLAKFEIFGKTHEIPFVYSNGRITSQDRQGSYLYWVPD